MGQYEAESVVRQKEGRQGEGQTDMEALKCSAQVGTDWDFELRSSRLSRRHFF